MRLRVRPTKKQSRQDMILKLVKERQINTQDDLSSLLTKFGFDVTQSSLSRDIFELGLIKQHGIYAIPPRHMREESPLITSIESAGPYLIVVKTIVGMAAPAGITIDGQKIPNVIGTVAGDDTVFVAITNGASHDVIKKAIKRLFREEK